MLIRRANKKDIDAISALLSQVLEIHHNGRPDIFKGNAVKYKPEELSAIIEDDTRPIFVAELDGEERGKIVIHDYPQLYEEFSLKGIHVNKNITSLPHGYKGLRTRSCHSFEEVKRYKDEYDYLFLSPIFDSISKIGYKSAFSKEQLLKASEEGIIDEKVVALGGITFDKIPFLEELGFGGVAMSGGIYGELNGENPVADLFNRFL